MKTKKIFVSDISLKYLPEMMQSMSLNEKKIFVENMVSLGFDCIELPTPGKGREDEIINRTITSGSGTCRISIPVGTTAESLENAWNSISKCKNPCLQIIMPASTVKMEYIFHKKADQMTGIIAALCRSASEKGCVVEYIVEDATRADSAVIIEFCKTATENGASIITICDDAGTAMPEDISALVKTVKSVVDATVFVQLSDKISMAAASAVAALDAGAEGIKTSAFNDTLLLSDKFADFLRDKGGTLGYTASLDSTAIHKKISAMKAGVSTVADRVKIGEDTVGTSISPDSTIDEISEKTASLGYELSEEDNSKVYNEFKRVSRRKSDFDIREFEAVIASVAMQVPSTFHIDSYVINSGNIITATANVTLIRGDEKLSAVSVGDGPIDAAFHAIEQIIGYQYELEEFQIQAVTEGREALGSALVKLRSGGKLYSGNGLSTDIVGSSIRAYINAINKIVYEED